MCRRRILLLACGMVLLTFGHAAGQGLFTPTNTLPIYGSPPGNFFQAKGDQIGQAHIGERYRELERRTVTLGVRSEMWMHVALVGSPRVEGWVFLGLSNGQQANLRLVQ